jgi:hypothetical protein
MLQLPGIVNLLNGKIMLENFDKFTEAPKACIKKFKFEITLMDYYASSA